MQMLMTLFAVIAGMMFSLAVAVLVEELIFGKVLGLVLAPRGRGLRGTAKLEAAVSNK
jgi:hypothetical protein